MLKTLTIKNFTIFQDSVVDFGPGINIVVGANGLGKSHLLKLAYTAAASSYQAKQENKTKKGDFEALLQEKLMDVFRAEFLENLVFGRTHPTEASVSTAFKDSVGAGIQFFIEYPSERKSSPVKLQLAKLPTAFLDTSPVFIPTREILSIIPAFAKFHREKDLLLDGTYFDLSFLAQLGKSDNIHPEIKKIVEKLHTQLDGEVVQESGRFYLSRKSGFKLEMPLVAEGLRKLAMLCCLLENEAIQPSGVLIWDEPEANLNPLLMVELAHILVQLASLGMQVIIATHSLFFLREMHIWLVHGKQQGRFFALDKHNGLLRVSQADSIEAIEPIAALDADLQQSERYLALEE